MDKINKIGFPTAKLQDFVASFKKKPKLLPAPKQDTFELSEKAKEQVNKGLENLKITAKKIELAPEDNEKLAGLTGEDRLNYIKALKDKGLYRAIEEQ